MKKLEELGISPDEWGYAKNKNGGWRVHMKNVTSLFNVAEIHSDEHGEANACFMSASPEMYSVLWDICFGESTTINCAKCGGNDHGDGIEHCSKTCPLYKARAALAKASGMIR